MKYSLVCGCVERILDWESGDLNPDLVTPLIKSVTSDHSFTLSGLQSLFSMRDRDS